MDIRELIARHRGGVTAVVRYLDATNPALPPTIEQLSTEHGRLQIADMQGRRSVVDQLNRALEELKPPSEEK